MTDRGAGRPLSGVRVVEFASIGPGPHAGMLLSDMGADVLRIDRPGGNGWPNPIMDRGRTVTTLDLRDDDGRMQAIAAVAQADILIEGYRPGVMERLGLGPEPMLACNPRLIYGRVTGWGQEGPLAKIAGHDITYLALTGALAAMGRQGEPAMPPLNLLGDFGGGSMLLVVGVLAALYERERSGRGRVIDAAIIDGVMSFMTMFAGSAATGQLSQDRANNILGGAAPFYRCYRCKDGREVAVGALEPAFFAVLCERLRAPPFITQERADWSRTAAWLEATFASEPRAHWERVFEGTDACVSPVLTWDEVPNHPHHVGRKSFHSRDHLKQPVAIPRFGSVDQTTRDEPS
ncbi:CaiB/BaiF CoA-transferase family protein [uncultured Sphingomonas sp.]|uniref:CaiB/BaiF CoA transferase family protein n=1 Tax=uncultured Sphingomonas sp. TaxID=158754 RepID=UPI0025DF60AF|nr:CaiB/BaiF CoA-transferase family protein [uncultured Sphingomonas sp.]